MESVVVVQENQHAELWNALASKITKSVTDFVTLKQHLIVRIDNSIMWCIIDYHHCVENEKLFYEIDNINEICWPTLKNYLQREVQYIFNQLLINWW